MYSPVNVHAVFSIHTMNICTRFLCAVGKTSTAGGGALIFDNENFTENMDHFRQKRNGGNKNNQR